MPSKIITQAITFDDVLLAPRYSDVVPAEVDVGTRLTRTDRAEHPDAQLADGHGHRERRWRSRLAQEGGLGVIHKNMSIERQTEEVDKVKRSRPTASSSIRSRCRPTLASLPRTRRWSSTTFRACRSPIVKDGQLVGIITRRDLRFLET